MNCSGESVKAAADYFRVPPSRILVICDDIYRDVGRLKIKRKGTDGGHRGLENIIYLLGSDEFSYAVSDAISDKADENYAEFTL